MSIKKTCFGRHWQHMLVKSTTVPFENGINFKLNDASRIVWREM